MPSHDSFSRVFRMRHPAACFADPPEALLRFETTDAEHGRIEARRHRVTHSVDWPFADRAGPGAPGMPGRASLACVEATRDDGFARSIIGQMR